MPQFMNRKKFIFLLIGVILLVALISLSLRDRQNASFPERIVKDTVGFAQSIVAKPTNYVTGFIKDIDAMVNTYEENKRLKSRLEEFGTLQAEVNELAIENKRLQKLVDKSGNLRKYDPIQANVIARNPDQWEEK